MESAALTSVSPSRSCRCSRAECGSVVPRTRSVTGPRPARHRRQPRPRSTQRCRADCHQCCRRKSTASVHERGNIRDERALATRGYVLPSGPLPHIELTSAFPRSVCGIVTFSACASDGLRPARALRRRPRWLSLGDKWPGARFVIKVQARVSRRAPIVCGCYLCLRGLPKVAAIAHLSAVSVLTGLAEAHSCPGQKRRRSAREPFRRVAIRSSRERGRAS